MTVEKGRDTDRLSTSSESVSLQTCSHALSHANPVCHKGIYHFPMIQMRKQRPRDAKSLPGDTRLRAAQSVHSSVSTTFSSSYQHIIIIFSGLVPLRRKGLPQSLPPASADLGTELCQWLDTIQMEGSTWLPKHAFWEHWDLQISLGMWVENK